jgi:uncharacterized protein involved in exopolysaccharide biosynthesis
MTDDVRPMPAALPLLRHWRVVLLAPLLAGALAVGLSFLLPKSFVSKTLLVPPQQPASASSALIAQLGALSGLAGSAAGAKTPADQYVALLRSATIADLLIDEFGLLKVYDVEFRFKAREELANNTRIMLGKKDGLISIEVEDPSPERAAQMANRYVEHLRTLTGRLALSESQQRRMLFETQLKQTRDQLTRAQQALQETGFSQNALKADARAAAEGYARLRAEITGAEVRVQALRRNLAETQPEVQQSLAVLGALRAQLARIEESADFGGAPDYVSKYREYKYQETLFDMLARHYEGARLDEAREGALIQVVDPARPAERHFRPRRVPIGATAAFAALLLALLFVWSRQRWHDAQVPRP